jgi:hypothetical protein
MKNIKIKIEKTENVRVVLYGYEAWSLTLRGKHSLRVFENRVLRKMFGPKGDVVTMKWRRIYTEELNFLYCSSNIFLRDQINKKVIGWTCDTYGGQTRCLQVFGGRPKERREINIGTELQEVRWRCKEWVALVQDKDRWLSVVNAVINLPVPQNAGNSLSS